MNIIDKEHKSLLREEWLSERYSSEGDVLQDEDGKDYINMEVEGDSDDDFNVKTEKVYLPDNLQTYDNNF